MLNQSRAFWGICDQASWCAALMEEFDQPYMCELHDFLLETQRAGKEIYPERSHWFTAFQRTALSAVRVIVLGQDPYHGAGQAHGLSFSVPEDVRIPPSLRNIYKELQQDLGVVCPAHGCLDAWAAQGVFLLNSVLTVESGKAGAHQRRGWERFTDKVIAILNEQPRPLVFWLWGAYAQKKAAYVDRLRHFVLEAPHPSPLSAHRGFLGGRYFSKTNAFLQQHGITPINW